MRIRSHVNIKHLAFSIAVLLGVTMLAGCGNGGGGGPTGATVSVAGKVLRADTNQAVDSPGATVTVGGKSAQTGTDGTFLITSVPASAASITVTATNFSTLTQPVKLTADATGVAAVGTLFLSTTGYTAAAHGRVVTSSNGQVTPVGGAKVTIAGVTVTTGTDGVFLINGLPIGLGSDPTSPIGVIQATGFSDKPIFGGGFALGTGTNELGDQQLGAPIGSTQPTPPYTITGQVLKGATPQPNTTVNITQQTSSGPVIIGTTQTNASGAFFFWVVPGSYTLLVPVGSNAVTQAVTVTAPNQTVTQNVQIQ